jgi:hypothetical protein
MTMIKAFSELSASKFHIVNTANVVLALLGKGQSVAHHLYPSVAH